MPTVADIIASAKELEPNDLRVLSQQIVQLEKEQRAIDLGPKGMRRRLIRLNDGEYLSLRQRSLPIEEDYGFYLQLFLDAQRHDRDLNFAQAYLTLKHLTGESGMRFDDWKSSFSFPFTLDVTKDNRNFEYLMDAHNCRDTLYFSIRKVVDTDDPRLKDGVYLPPFADEFSRDEINYFLASFYGYLIGCWEVLHGQRHDPFVRGVASNGILFGYCSGRAFEEDFDTEEAFEIAKKRYESDIERELQGGMHADLPVIRRIP